jgi:phi13 family phage major tail protein
MPLPVGGTPKLVTGIKNVFVAEVLTDVQGGATTYDTPGQLDGATESLDITDNVNSAEWYGDNQAVVSTSAKGAIESTLLRQSLSDAQAAYILGNSVVNSYVEDNVADVAPYFALMYELTHDDGGSKFVQIDKNRFQENTKGATTKTDSVTFQPDEIIGKGIARLSDGRRKRSRIVDVADVATVRASFFGDANDTAPTALTLTTTPLDADTGVVVSADIVLTYNNEMLQSTVVSPNVQLIKASDGIPVAITWTPDLAKEVWTGTHADLDATSDYILVVTDNVRDVYGQGLDQIANFTTA